MNYKNLYEKIENTIKSGCPPEKICVILLNSNKEKDINKLLKNKTISIFHINSFVNNILKNSPMAFNSTILTNYLATQIIKNISKTELSKNKVMKNLTKSDTFFRELYNLFGLYKVNKITPNTLYKIAQKTNIENEDKQRFTLTIDIYKKYCEILKENNFMDYKDTVSNCILILQRSRFLLNNIRNKYKYIFIIDAQELNELQIDLFNLIVNKNNLILFGDKNITTYNYMGANASLEKEFQKINCDENKDVSKRAELFISNTTESLKKSNSIEYRTFNDFKSEIDYIANDVIKKNNKGTTYSDFAILLRDSDTKNSVIDLCRKYNLPVSGEIKSEEFESFKQDLYNYVEFCDLLEKLDINEFHYKTIKQDAKITSKYDIEKYSKQLSHCFQTIKKNTFNFKDDIKIYNFLNNLNKYYKEKEFIKFIFKIADINKIQDETFHKFMAKYLKNLREIIKFNKEVYNNECDAHILIDLLEFIIEDNEIDENKITITTFFKSTGLKYKYVYIPSLIDDYFPKKAKNTLFISEISNAKLSEEIKKEYPNFTKIILSTKDELKDENNLMYSAILCTEEKIVLSTHKYDSKKLVIPSQYYEKLVEVDSENEIKNQEEKKEQNNTVENSEYKKNDNTIIEKNVINESDELNLSASSITTFLACKRKFYYEKLLGLKTEGGKTAIYGTAIHAIFENILKNHITQFSKEKFVEIGKILFDLPTNKQKIEEAGFDINELEEFLQFSPIEIKEAEQKFYLMLNELEKKSDYFYNIPIEAECEKEFKFSLPNIPNITFNGKIDAIISYGNDTWSIFDYKTGSRIKPNIKQLFSDEGIKFLSKGEYSEDKMRNYKYQMPLYYLASLYSDNLSKYKNSLFNFGYFYLHPLYKSEKDMFDMIAVKDAQKNKEEIIDNIKKYIIDELKQKTYFEADGSANTCQYCNFKEICEGKSEENDD